MLLLSTAARAGSVPAMKELLVSTTAKVMAGSGGIRSTVSTSLPRAGIVESFASASLVGVAGTVVPG